MTRNAILAASVTLLLAACGGGSSTATTTGDETNTTGTSGGENGGGATTDAGAGAGTTETGGGGGGSEELATRVAAGQERFDHVCGVCHPGGDGDTGPDLHNKHFTVDRMTNQIRNGSGHMRPIPEARLSAADLPNVLAWLSTIGAVDGVR